MKKPACGLDLKTLTSMTFTRPGASRTENLVGASMLASTQGTLATPGTSIGRETSHATHPGKRMILLDYKKHTELPKLALQARLFPL